MNIQPAQQVPANVPQSDQSPCLCHDTPECPDQATVEINANQLARIAELLDVLYGFQCGGWGWSRPVAWR